MSIKNKLTQQKLNNQNKYQEKQTSPHKKPTMIKKQVLLRSQIRTIYSSQRQQRMKVYFDLNDQYNECVEPCKLQPADIQETCQKDCEKVFDKYAHVLKERYENQNKERLDLQVKNAPIFNSRVRKDRDGWFYDIFGVGFGEFIGTTPEPKVKEHLERI